MKTKKMCVLGVLLMAVICLGMLAGCGHTHEWTEANCVQPKSCTSCDATEGEALGHQPATEANYQSAALCGVCGEAVGEALVADFVTLGIDTDLKAVGDTADYITASGTGPEVTGKTTLVSYEICPSYREIEAREGYECRVAVFDTVFGGDVMVTGVQTRFYVTDYYNTALFAANPDHSDPIYSVTNVNYNGEEVPIYVSQMGGYDAQGDTVTFNLIICMQVPVGYDGAVCGLVHCDSCDSMDDIAKCYAPEDFVLFRMAD